MKLRYDNYGWTPDFAKPLPNQTSRTYLFQDSTMQLSYVNFSHHRFCLKQNKFSFMHLVISSVSGWSLTGQFSISDLRYMQTDKVSVRAARLIRTLQSIVLYYFEFFVYRNSLLFYLAAHWMSEGCELRQLKQHGWKKRDPSFEI